MRDLERLIIIYIGSLFASYLTKNMIDYMGLVISNLKLLFIVLGIMALGFAVFLIRSHYRLLYGYIEFLVGVLSALSTILICLKKESFVYYDILGALGGFYIIVRGLDNIGKGIDKAQYVDTWFKNTWQRIFGKD